MTAHLRLLPSPRARGVEAIPSADLLARRTGDHRAEVARLTLVIADQHETIAELRERLELAAEAGDALLARIAALEAQRPRPRASLAAAWWAALTLAWATCWGWFETPASREGLT